MKRGRACDARHANVATRSASVEKRDRSARVTAPIRRRGRLTLPNDQPLLVAQRDDRIEGGSAPRRPDAEQNADEGGEGERETHR